MERQKVLNDWLQRVCERDQTAQEAARKRLNTLTKPPGSLAQLEEIAIRLAGITGQHRPRLGRKHVVVMCADHGVAAEGVSAFPQAVTGLMIHNFAAGKAAINVLARQVGADVVVVDVGSCCDELPPVVRNQKVRSGTANMAKEPAMSRDEALQAILVGIDTAERLVGEGSTLLALGEMGIGNTTASAAIARVWLNDASLDALVGRGTGVDDAGLERKKQVIAEAIQTHQPDPSDPVDVAAKVGGLEIAALAGVIIGAAANRCPVLVDGVITAAAALVANRLQPLTTRYLFASHLSAEPAHALLLKELGLVPFLHLGMRLGEGTGAALAMPILEAACRILDEMATFADLGLPDPVVE
ncbi:MAG: nicotinate-nucleotide--dimethylbenzimidazole phosphoribosyltransferase [Brevibacillus sp.]|nr:nicotinate-nucleotide--dimethylbenzimidazole phosphoribosyltransferase [Brevibacillus sp.]